MTPCPQCGGRTALIAGIVLYEHRDRSAYPHTFDVCWADGIHRQHGRNEWLPLGAASQPAKVEWNKHHKTHWSMWLHGQQLHYWPTKRKVSWKGRIMKGYDLNGAMDLAKSIAGSAP